MVGESSTLLGFASSRICVMAAGGRMGLKAESWVPDGGCSFTAIDWRQWMERQSFQDCDVIVTSETTFTRRHFSALTFGAVVWKFMFETGTGAEDSMEMITTRTSGRDGGESRAKWKRTRRLCLSNTVTGKRLPVTMWQERGRKEINDLFFLKAAKVWALRCLLTRFNGF